MLAQLKCEVAGDEISIHASPFNRPEFMAERNTKPDINRYPSWAPRFWHSMLFTDWIRLLAQHGFRVHPNRLGFAVGATFLSSFNSKMRIAQLALHGHGIKKTLIAKHPIFILGHWRSGTTLLHELLSVDQRFSTPSTYQCFAANHFLLTEAVITKLFWFLIPSKRPMDNMHAGWEAPQEDEFALCAMGLPSPYLRLAFPNRNPKEFLEYLDMQGIAPPDLEQWKSVFSYFLKSLSKHVGKQLILKSPTHTGRLALLAEMFPNAKFIHISRNPYDVVPSTVRLWRSLEYVQAMQNPDFQHLPDYVFRAYRKMYDGYFAGRKTLSEDRLIEVDYESLVANGEEVVADIYQKLSLGDFDSTRAALAANIESRKSYKKNEHQLDDELVRQINEHWHDYFENFGYELRCPEPSVVE